MKRGTDQNTGASYFGGNAGECVGDGVNVKSVVRGLLLRKVRIVTFFIPENERRRNNVEQDVVGHRRRPQSPEPRRRQNSGHLLEIPTLRSVAAF